MTKYAMIALGALSISLAVGLNVVWGKYEDTKEQLALEKTNRLQLQKEIDYQNDKIQQMALDTESFKRDYDETISKKSASLNNIKEIKDCNTVLFLLEREF